MPAHGYEIQASEAVETFFTTCPFRIVAVNILEPLPRMKKGNEFVVIIRNIYRVRTRGIPTAKITSTQVTHIRVNDWVMP